MAASSGTGQGDFERLTLILKEIPGVTYICLDVANGYSQHFVEYVRKVRATFPNHTIIVSQVLLVVSKYTDANFDRCILSLILQIKILLT